MTDQENDNGEHNKEVYAHFGLAYSQACVFESGLTNAILYLDYLADVKRSFKGAETFDRIAFETGFDAFMAKQQAATLGTLVKRAQSVAEMDADLKALILKAVTRRNFLAHRFFWERAVDFMKSDGRDRMIEELKDDIALFDEADRTLFAFIEPYRVKLGMTDKVMQKWMARYYEEQGLTGEFRND